MLIVLYNDETRYYNVNSSLSKISIRYSPTIRCRYQNDKLIVKKNKYCKIFIFKKLGIHSRYVSHSGQ